jgi:hypothetical protein
MGEYCEFWGYQRDGRLHRPPGISAGTPVSVAPEANLVT